MFDNPQTNLGNPYSGKHNFHGFIGGFDKTVDDIVDNFEDFLNDAIGLNPGDVCEYRLNQVTPY